MKRVDVDRLIFEFNDHWLVEKWDEHPCYRQGIARVQGELDGANESTKAVDVIACTPQVLVLIEAKDFRRCPDMQPNSVRYGGRWKALPLEIALKVRDTLAGLVGVAVAGQPSALAGALERRLRAPVHVVACIVQEERSSESHRKRKTQDMELRANIRRRLAWLGRDIHVCDLLHESVRCLPGVVVTSQSTAPTD